MAQSSHYLSRLAHMASASQSKLAKIREKTEETMGAVKQTAEVVGGAALFSYAAGRYGTGLNTDGTQAWNVPKTKLPISLAAGLGMKLLAFGGLAGKYDEDLHSLGDGALCSY